MLDFLPKLPKPLIYISVLILLSLFCFVVVYSINNNKTFLMFGVKWGFENDKAKINLDKLSIKYVKAQSSLAQAKLDLESKNREISGLKVEVKTLKAKGIEKSKQYSNVGEIRYKKPWSDFGVGIKLVELDSFIKVNGISTYTINLDIPHYGKINQEIIVGDKWNYEYKGNNYKLVIVSLGNEKGNFTVKVEKI